MEINSVSPSVEMLRACFATGIDFTVNYKSGISISVSSPFPTVWGVVRSKNGVETSSFTLGSRDEEAYSLNCSDPLVKSMLVAVWADIHNIYPLCGTSHKGYASPSPQVPSLAGSTKFLEATIRLLGGPISKIVSVEKGKLAM